MFARLTPDTQHRIAKVVANLLLVGLVIYLGVAMAKATWLFAWNDKPVAVAPSASASRASLSGSSGGYPMASYELFGRPEVSGEVAEVKAQASRRSGRTAPGRFRCYSGR